MIININLKNIFMDRHPINQDTLNLVKFLEMGGKIPPIKLQKLWNGNFKILDGRHRVTAYKLLGKEKILCKVK